VDSLRLDGRSLAVDRDDDSDEIGRQGVVIRHDVNAFFKIC
jgi:hypothetical protein